MKNKIPVVLVDDHTIFRQGLTMVINRIDGFTVAGEAGNGKELLHLLNRITPDIVLMDIRMPVMDGIEATKRALDMFPKLKIAALSSNDDEESLQTMIKAGAAGFLIKSIDRDTLETALIALANNQNYYSPKLLPYFTNRYLGTVTEESDIHITRREKEVLQQISLGRNTKEIAEQLHISPRTVEGHKANLIEKTGSKNIVNLLIFAIKNGLVEI